MRNILILCSLILVALAGVVVWKLRAPAHYGQPFHGAPRVELSELVTHPEKFKEQSVQVSGTVFRQCPVTGCWFYFRAPDGRELRVELGDVVTGLPTKLNSGATVEGKLLAQGGGYVFIGNGVEFGKPSVSAEAVPAEKAVQNAVQTSKPMSDGYPVDFCVVGGEKLDSMGEPVVHDHEGRKVKFCCASCVKSFNKDPARFLKILDEAATKTQNATGGKKE